MPLIDKDRLVDEGNGDPYGTRTRVFAVRGRRPRPLDEGARRPFQMCLTNHSVVTPTGIEPVFQP
jgi:hypothetical protein